MTPSFGDGKRKKTKNPHPAKTIPRWKAQLAASRAADRRRANGNAKVKK